MKLLGSIIDIKHGTGYTERDNNFQEKEEIWIWCLHEQKEQNSCDSSSNLDSIQEDSCIIPIVTIVLVLLS